jgi:hypothetical protein
VAGDEATFHVVLTRSAETWNDWRCFEAQMKPGLFGNAKVFEADKKSSSMVE